MIITRDAALVVIRVEDNGKGLRPDAIGAEASTIGAISVDGEGNSYVTGLYRFFLTFDESTTLPEIASGVADLFVAKYDSNGTFLWAIEGGVNFIPGSGAAGKPSHLGGRRGQQSCDRPFKNESGFAKRAK